MNSSEGVATKSWVLIGRDVDTARLHNLKCLFGNARQNQPPSIFCTLEAKTLSTSAILKIKHARGIEEAISKPYAVDARYLTFRAAPNSRTSHAQKTSNLKLKM